MADSNIKILKKETYVQAIVNSPGSRIFNSLFVRFKDSGMIADIMRDGEYSCAFFVSSILYLFQMADKVSSTVQSLREFVEKNSRWRRIDSADMQAGDIVFWLPFKHDDGTETAHVGFALDVKDAVSTDYKLKTVARHDAHARTVDAVYRFSF